jgi:hypothetical protein
MIKETGSELKETELSLCVHEDKLSLHGRHMKEIVAYNYCNLNDGKDINIQNAN